MTIDIRYEPDAATAASVAASTITELLTSYQDIPILFLVSGGSPLEIIKRLSPEPFDKRVTVGVSDERHSSDPLINNFVQIQQTDWYKGIIEKGVQWIDTLPHKGESVEEGGRRFDAALKAWKQKNPSGKIVVTQGIGLDGHTAGIMPYPEDTQSFTMLFDNPEAWAAGYDAGAKNKYPLRVTTTLPFLRMVDDSVIFACGPDKKKPLTDVFAKEGSVSITPGRIIHQMKHCLLFTDQLV